jgi:hypothetical protein
MNTLARNAHTGSNGDTIYVIDKVIQEFAKLPPTVIFDDIVR